MLRYVLLLAMMAAAPVIAQDRYIRDLRKEAKKGDVHSQFKLGMAYADAYKVKRDFEAAIQWLSLAGEQGHAQAQEFLGKLYFTGSGVEKDLDEAARWFERSASLGNPEAQLLLAGMYNHGDGLPQDFRKAAHWFRLAAEQGHPQAQYNLGALYNNGEGVEQDPVAALKWIYLASTNPPEEFAQEYVWVRDDLVRSLPQELVQEAKSKARDWKPRTWEALQASSRP